MDQKYLRTNTEYYNAMKTASAKMSSTNNTYLIHTKSIMMVQCNSFKVKISQGDFA